MPDYSKSKIYRVYCEDDEYIGSTTRPLSERMNEHRRHFKSGSCSSKVIFEKHGVENCRIELIEDYPCERIEQLNKREGEIQRERTCVNKQVAGRTISEWYLDNSEKIQQYYKEYNVENREHIVSQKAEYNKINSEKRKKYMVEYRKRKSQQL